MSVARHTCGEAQDATGPGNGHSHWHRRLGTPLCGKARTELNWYAAERKAGRSLPDYKPVRNYAGYECGPAEAATGPSAGHYKWHRRYDTAQCGLALREMAWRNAEVTAGHPIPDYEPHSMFDPEAQATVYQITFLDGDRYYGVTAREPETRWREHWGRQSPLGEKMRSGVPFVTEVLCVAPTRRQAREIESMAIKAGNPWGAIINLQECAIGKETTNALR